MFFFNIYDYYSKRKKTTTYEFFFAIFFNQFDELLFWHFIAFCLKNILKSAYIQPLP